MNFVRFRVSRLFCVSFLLHFVNFCRTDFYLQYLYFLEPRSIPCINIYLIIIILSLFAGLQKVLDGKLNDQHFVRNCNFEKENFRT